MSDNQIVFDPLKRMTAKEFREAGYLRELNRQFLHPLGLALEVEVAADGTESFGAVWDYRDDPEGILFTDQVLQTPEALAGAKRIRAEAVAKWPTRSKLWRGHGLGGTNIQPIGGLSS